MPKVATLALAIAAGLAAGCGGGSLVAPTATVDQGTQVAPNRYLADATSGAAAVRTFTQELAAMGPTATPAGLKSVAPRLMAPLDQARLVGQRLLAERLADRRLEEQRSRTSAAFQNVVAAMEGVVTAAGAGDPQAARTANTSLHTAIDALRAASTSTG